MIGFGRVGMSGTVKMKVRRAAKAPLGWRLRNALRWTFAWGWLTTLLARFFTRFTGVVTLTSALALRVKTAGGEWVDYGVVSRRVVTNAGVALLIDDFVDATGEVTNFNFHGVGSGNTAEAAGDTALVTEYNTELNPNALRATGTKSNPSAPVYRTIGTATFDANVAIVEHGLFDNVNVGSGTLWDRSVFAVINLSSGDSLQATYELTANAGG